MIGTPVTTYSPPRCLGGRKICKRFDGRGMGIDRAPDAGPQVNRSPPHDKFARLASPGALHDDPVEKNIWVIALDPAVPPNVDLGVDRSPALSNQCVRSLTVQVRNRARADPRAPKRLCDVLDAPHRNARQIHLDQGLFDRALPAPVERARRWCELLVDIKARGLRFHLRSPWATEPWGLGRRLTRSFRGRVTSAAGSTRPPTC